jgi:hypothetical protein
MHHDNQMSVVQARQWLAVLVDVRRLSVDYRGMPFVMWTQLSDSSPEGLQRPGRILSRMLTACEDLKRLPILRWRVPWPLAKHLA